MGFPPKTNESPMKIQWLEDKPLSFGVPVIFFRGKLAVILQYFTGVRGVLFEYPMISKTGHHKTHQDSYDGDRRGRTPDVREVGERIDGATPLPKSLAMSL